MPRIPAKVVIRELEDGRYSYQPVIMSTGRRIREFDTKEALLEHFWKYLVVTEEPVYVQYVSLEMSEEDIQVWAREIK